MALTAKKPSEKRAEARTRRRQGEPTRFLSFFESSRFIAFSLFIFLAALITTICFWNPPTRSHSIAIGQISLDNIVAHFDFTYESRIETEKERASLRMRVPPTLTRIPNVIESFEQTIHSLDSELREAEKQETPEEPETPAPPETEPEETPANQLPEAVLAVLSSSKYEHLPTNQLKDLLLKTTPDERTRYFSRCLTVLYEIHSHAILPPQHEFYPTKDLNSHSLITLPEKKDQGNSVNPQKTILTLNAARDTLKFEIRKDQEIPTDLHEPLITFFSPAIKPNLRYDAAAHKLKIQQLEAKTPPVMVSVKKNEVILSSGEEITKEVFEKIDAFRKQERQRGYTATQSRKILLRGLFIACTLLGIIWFCLKIGYLRISGRNRTLGLAALAIVANLLLIRVILQLVELPQFQDQEHLYTLLPYLSPTAFAPLIIAILAGPTLAILSAFIISILFSFMLEGATEIFLASFCATLTGIYLCRNISQRSKLMQASIATGVINALLALFIGLLSETNLQLIGIHILTCLGVSVVTGMLVIGILPILENAFKFVTDIRLLELTDTNHPLLRRLQMEAPGTYHHSLMVANLSENAAVKLGANPLKCRACALFHDVGKLAKPEYFIENQISGHNPHKFTNPSMSALIIKSHIPEGVELAKEHKLPRIIIDVIRQHHGTGLIHYFFREAQKQADKELPGDQHPDELPSNGNDQEVDESTYRYGGPKPQFKESAIIFFADAIEAASRSLPKLNAQSLEELIDNIFEERLGDGQLDETPMTFQEIADIKKSFIFTLLNMAHARTQYPDQKEKAQKKEKEKDAKTLEQVSNESFKNTASPFPVEANPELTTPKSEKAIPAESPRQ